MKLQFVCFPQSSGQNFVDLFISDEKILKVETPYKRFSEEYSLDRQSEWKIGKHVLDANGKISFRTYCTIPAIKSNQQLIVLIRKGVYQEDGFDAKVIDKKIANFKGGDYYVVNLSNLTTVMRIGDSGKPVQIRPARIRKITPKLNRMPGREKNIVSVKLGYLKENKFIAAYDSVWRYRKITRSMVFLYQDPNNKKLRRHSIVDYL